MAVSSDYLQFILEQLHGLGQVHARRMFGAAGLYCEEIFFGIISEDTLYLRVDEANRADYTARGMAGIQALCGPARGEHELTSRCPRRCWKMPQQLLDLEPPCPGEQGSRALRRSSRKDVVPGRPKRLR